MSFDTEKKKAGREPVYMADLLLDYCDHAYGVAPCAAVLGGTGSIKCFNTRATCQDPANYSPSPKTYRFVQPRVGFPPGFQRVSSLRGVQFSPTVLDEDGGLGLRGQVTLEFQDHPHHDRGIDKYVAERSYDPEEQGTFWGKLRARNPYYKGRVIRIYEGYITEPFDINNFRSRDYVIESISPPDPSGSVRVVAKDILKLADGEKAVWPPVTTGELAQDLASNSDVIHLTPGSGPQYDGFSYVAIGDAIIKYTGRNGDTLTGCVHAQGGTAKASHSAGEKVQVCADYDNENVVNITRDLLTGPSKMPASYINDTEWNTERDGPLKTFNLSAIIPKPTAVKDLLRELLRQCLIAVWQDDVDAMVKLKSLTPWAASEATLTDKQLVAGRTSIRDLPDRRLSRVRTYHGIRNYAEDLDEPKNYKRLFVSVESDAESAHKHNEIAEEVFYSRWFDVSNITGPALLGSRLLDRYSEIPQSIQFTLDARHETFRTGAVVTLNTRLLVDEQGLNKTVRVLITRSQPDRGHQYHYSAVTFPEVPQPVLNITEDKPELDIYTLLSAPIEPVNVTVNVTADAIYSTAPSVAALASGPLATGSTITLGIGSSSGESAIYGCGGRGGNGGAATAFYEKEFDSWQLNEGVGDPGSDGGPAIESSVDITIDNTHGYIFGGGGGGAGGAGDAQEGQTYGGGGGGGGRSYHSVRGGSAGGPSIYAELATIYEDSAGNIAKANPFLNEVNGAVEFYAENDNYTVEYSGPVAKLITGIAVADNTDATYGAPPGTPVGSSPAEDIEDGGNRARAGLDLSGVLEPGVHDLPRLTNRTADNIAPTTGREFVHPDAIDVSRHVDMSKVGVVNRTADNIAPTVGREFISPSYIDGSRRPIKLRRSASDILPDDISLQTEVTSHLGGQGVSTIPLDTKVTNRTLDYIADSATYARTNAAALTNGDVDLSKSGVLKHGFGYDDGNSRVTVERPEGGHYSENGSSLTGAIKIQLPVLWTSTMLRFRIDVYDYSWDESVSIDVGGYNYAGSTSWGNTFAHLIGKASRAHKVRFGHDGTKACVWIGETTTVWRYPKVVVRAFQGGFSNATLSNWASGWSVTRVTAFDTVQVTQDYTLPSGATEQVGSEARLGDERNARALVGWNKTNGAPNALLTASDAGTTSTISIPAHTRYSGFGATAFVGASITGLPFETFHLVYRDTPTFDPAENSYVASTDQYINVKNSDRATIGGITTPADGSTGGSSGGFDECVAADAWVLPGVRARDVKRGMLLHVSRPQRWYWRLLWRVLGGRLPARWTPRLTEQHQVRLLTAGGAVLECSTTTPFDLPDGRVALAPFMRGEQVLTDRGIERVVHVQNIGRGLVARISVFGHSFAAGEDARYRIYSHNSTIKP